MSTRTCLFGKKLAKSKYEMANAIAEGEQVIPLLWFSLFCLQDLKENSTDDYPPFDLTTSTKAALERMPSSVATIERIIGSKGECEYAAKLLSEAISLSGHKYLSIDLTELVEEMGGFDEQIRAALAEIAEEGDFENLSGLSAVDDYKSIKMSKDALISDKWSAKDCEAVDLLLGYPAIETGRWHKLIISASKKNRR